MLALHHGSAREERLGELEYTDTSVNGLGPLRELYWLTGILTNDLGWSWPHMQRKQR